LETLRSSVITVQMSSAILHVLNVSLFEASGFLRDRRLGWFSPTLTSGGKFHAPIERTSPKKVFPICGPSPCCAVASQWGSSLFPQIFPLLNHTLVVPPFLSFVHLLICSFRWIEYSRPSLPASGLDSQLMGTLLATSLVSSLTGTINRRTLHDE